jgi:hypothetical protein
LHVLFGNRNLQLLQDAVCERGAETRSLELADIFCQLSHPMTGLDSCDVMGIVSDYSKVNKVKCGSLSSAVAVSTQAHKSELAAEWTH